jgi:hypothetical protein
MFVIYWKKRNLRYSAGCVTNLFIFPQFILEFGIVANSTSLSLYTCARLVSHM